MQKNIKLKIMLPKIANIELVAIEGLNRLAKHLGVPEQKIGDVRILVAEAINNAFEHAGNKSQRVRVEFTIKQKKLFIYVRDYGQGFEPEKIDNPDIFSKMASPNKRGWGLKLMKSMSDDFKIESGSNGTKITLTKNLT